MVFKKTMFLLLLQNFLLISSSLVGLGYEHHSSHSLLTDKAALLEFKKGIRFDPNLSLANWQESNDVCNFTGVICNPRHHRVANLTLNRTGLVGYISPFISNLTGLRYLQLAENYFSSPIPPEISLLWRLRFLKIHNNNMQGSIPESLSLLQNLQLLHLFKNNLTGPIPSSLFSNCTMLQNVDLSENRLTGNIPPEVGNCPYLWNLNLYNNQFTGQIPFSLTNTSYLYNLDLEYNHISGELPSDIVVRLNQLVYLHISYNNMTSHDANTNLDPFFTSLANCSYLEELEMEGMGLGGNLSNSIGLGGLSLKTLVLNGNKISGSIPPSLGHFPLLRNLNLSSNLLSGAIPPEISGLSNLQQLVLSHNLLNGSIPKKLGNIRGLGHLDLSHNSLSGNIPESIGNLVQLNFLFLNNNNLSGTVPRSLGQCIDLNKLDFSYNRLTGSIPSEISSLLEIRIFLNLSNNLLEGPLPIELSKLQNVQEIDLSANKFNGSIFDSILNCIALRLLNLSYNSLQGPLPESLGDFKNLEVFDVSGNQLSGRIPASLNRTHTLTFLNLSFNNFDGQIPYGGIFDLVTNLSFLGNPHLCGSVVGMPPCHKKRNWLHSHMFVIIFSVVISISAFLSTIGCVIGCRYIKRIMSSGNSQAVRKSTPDLVHNFPRITYRELSEATGGFDEQRLIGSGSYGRVYKGVLSDGTAIAVKVLQLQTGNSTKSFNRECQVLKRIRHRNLIRIITACSLPDFKALVLPYMANGSLDSCLYPHSETGLRSGSSDLSLIQRVNICSDIAEGMAYLHHHSPVRVIHCDLKPSNVLLNDDMTALVSDFGISRLVTTAGNAGAIENTGNSTANMLSGSIGYIAPGTTTSPQLMFLL